MRVPMIPEFPPQLTGGENEYEQDENYDRRTQAEESAHLDQESSLLHWVHSRSPVFKSCGWHPDGDVHDHCSSGHSRVAPGIH